MRRHRMLVVASAVIGWLVVGLAPAMAICAGGNPLLDTVEEVDTTIVRHEPDSPVEDPDALVIREGITASVVVGNWDHYPLERTFERQGITGIYEQHTLITSSAFLFVRDDVSVSIVTRYWGEPPANLGLQAKGGALFQPLLMLPDDIFGIVESGSCEWVSSSGTSEYGVIRRGEEDSRQGAPLTLINEGEAQYSEFGSLTDVEGAALEARFGPPTVVTTPLASVRAFLWVWSAPVLFSAGVALLLWMFLRHRWKRRARRWDQSVAEV